ncbi:MAG: DUF262 domain-containing HNH endonuclease family protein [Candidatus Thermoplasmatota archaeon]|nr:DUF262 domain-containing HNH endonuclease family protein [Candidatus Thermoplasmatota archaeon]
MQAIAQDVGHILGSRDQYVIPRFQRYYEWESANRERLWNDIVTTAFDSEGPASHFFGSIVAIPTPHQMGQVTPYLVIDGQQRLTTVSLLLVALRDIAEERGFKAEAEKIEDLYLIHKHERDADRFRLLLRHSDRGMYVGLLERKPLSADSNLHEAYLYLRQVASAELDEQPDPLVALQTIVQAATSRLNVVSITLADENPFEIFKSLNSTGLPLAEADLIRNHVFMNIPLEESAQAKFEQDFWAPFERTLRHQNLDSTLFYRHYLMRDGKYVKEDEAYRAFESEWSATKPKPEEKLREMEWFAQVYRNLLGIDKAQPGAFLANLAQPIGVLRRLGVTTAFPLALNLASRLKAGAVDGAEFSRAIWAINSFVLRRYVCQESSRAYSRWFVAGIPRQGDPVFATLAGFLKGKGWPTDARFCEALRTFGLYAGDSSPYARELLSQIVRATEPKDESVNLDGCEIEHVLPQSISTGNPDGDDWIQVLGGEGWEQAQWRVLNTLGNLTLVGRAYNRSVRNSRFGVKKPELEKSIVALNRYFSGVDRWGEREILDRTAALSATVSKVFPPPLP